MENTFVIGDIHGEREKAEILLKKWNTDNEQLVFLGDLVDRGPDSYGVIKLAMELVKKYGAKVVGGNHEDMFLNWLKMPFSEMDLYYPQGGRETIHSFFDKPMTHSFTPLHIANLLQEQFEEEINFLQTLPNYYEKDDYVFVHAGVNLALEDWKNSREIDFRWIREPFHYGKNETGKTFFFGHTPTPYLNRDKSYNVWISPCKTKIGMDGGAVFGGMLHGSKIENGICTIHSIDRNFDHTTKAIIIQPSV